MSSLELRHKSLLKGRLSGVNDLPTSPLPMVAYSRSFSPSLWIDNPLLSAKPLGANPMKYLLLILSLLSFLSSRASVANSLFDGKTFDGWIQAPTNSWVVKDGAMASTGAGRGVIYTTNQFSR